MFHKIIKKKNYLRLKLEINEIDINQYYCLLNEANLK